MSEAADALPGLEAEHVYEPTDATWAAAAMGRLAEDRSNFDVRLLTDLGRASALSALLKQQNNRVVLTSGSFDIIHEGHSMYLEAARGYGDFLIVGVDSDEKIVRRKGPGRPAVPEMERLRMVTHQRGVGAVVLKRTDHRKWDLIKAVRPDTLVATEETYTRPEIATLERGLCGEVVVLPRMATVSTSARLRLMQLDFLRGAADAISAELGAVLLPQLPGAVARAVSNMMRNGSNTEQTER